MKGAIRVIEAIGLLVKEKSHHLSSRSLVSRNINMILESAYALTSYPLITLMTFSFLLF
jgi:hypothetical protein